VSAYTLGSIGIVAFHLAAWLAAGPGDRGLGDPDGLFARVGWPLVTVLLGTVWSVLFVFTSWRLIAARALRPIGAIATLVMTVITPPLLSAFVNVPYKGASAADFLDVFLFPGGITPGGNGTIQHILMSAVAAGVAAVQVAHARSGTARGVPS